MGKLYSRLFLVALSILSLTACVDDSWDLTQIKHDETLLFSKGLSLPGGNVELIHFSKDRMLKMMPSLEGMLIERDGGLLIEDKAGSEVLSTDSFKDELFASLSFTGVSDKVVDVISHPSAGQLPDAEYHIDEFSFVAISTDMESNEAIERLDKVELTDAKIQFDIRFSGIQSAAAGSILHLEMRIPKGFFFGKLPASTTLVGDLLKIKIPLSEIINGKKSMIDLPLHILENPLSMGEFKVDGYIVAKSVQVTGNVDLHLTVKPLFTSDNLYKAEGKFNYEFDEMELALKDNLLEDLTASFGNDAVADFHAPRVRFSTKGNVTAPVDVMLYVAYVNKQGKSCLDSVLINFKPAPNYAIHHFEYEVGNRRNTKSSATFFPFDLARVIREGASNLRIYTKAKLNDKAQSHTIYGDMSIEITPTLEIPFVFGEEFRLTTEQIKTDVFTPSIKQTLFRAQGSEVTIVGDVQKRIPLNVILDMEIVDANGQSMDIKASAMSITNNDVHELVFQISEEDAPRMADASGIRILTSMAADAQLAGQDLLVTDFIDISNLKIRKKGGIIMGGNSGNNQ